MLNAANERELAYIVKIDKVEKHPNADRLDIAHVGGWHCIVGRDEFKDGDLGVYFEIDSKLPEVQPFSDMEFLVSKHYKIKSQKIRGEISQGLLVHLVAFMGTKYENAITEAVKNVDENKFLTQALEVTYSVVEDNRRKGNSGDKYKKMAQRHGDLFKHQPFRWLMKRTWGKKLLFVFFGKKRDKRTAWPGFVAKTDEERVQNLPGLFTDPSREEKKWIVTEKIDGTSCTAAVRRKKFGGFDTWICSRNVVFDKKKTDCYYDVNYYTEAAQKYHFFDVLTDIANKLNADTVILQGEIYGDGVQKRDYSLTTQKFAGFNLIINGKRLNSIEAARMMEAYDIPWVPILDEEFVIPATCEEMLEYAENASSVDGLAREGVVLRSQDGVDSFKAVSNSFLLKYHA